MTSMEQKAQAYYITGTQILMNLPLMSSTPGSDGWLQHRLLKTLNKAIQHLQEAVKLDPHFADAFHNLALAIFSLGEHKYADKSSKQVMRDLDRALYDPAEHKAIVNTLRKHVARVDKVDLEKAEHDIDTTFEFALEAVDKALAIRHEFPQAHNTRAMVLAKLGRLDEAMEATEVALSQSPDYKNAIDNREKIKELRRQA